MYSLLGRNLPLGLELFNPYHFYAVHQILQFLEDTLDTPQGRFTTIHYSLSIHFSQQFLHFAEKQQSFF